MSNRHEIEEQCKSVINHTVAARNSLNAAQADLKAMIDQAVNELVNDGRYDGILIRGFITESEDMVPIEVPGFQLPTLSDYAIARGVTGLIALRSLEGSDKLSAIGRIIPLAEIPLTGSPEYTKFSLESVAKELAELRRKLCGTGIEG